MKNRSVLLALVLGIGLFVTSCSDDNEGETLAPLSGKWNLSKVGTIIGGQETLVDAPQNEAGCNKDYLDLNADNTLTEGDYDSTIDPCTLSTTSGIYSRSHNNLTTVVNGVTQVQDIENLTLTELKLKDANGAIEVYTKG
ncbi:MULTISPECIES: lipocalin family protein [unclassified Flavobacterium]|uniref:lipocalin family protein n=1 Tax=unclassified Flavobacterium TaxID=196869 RepID=UPI000EB49D7F|nr:MULTISPECIES: lipocalin family protein [unclassified Flavobacterium]RKS02145.1 lipocalin-like protein [Flavobacterium sp. 102]